MQERQSAHGSRSDHPFLIARGDLQQLFVLGITKGGKRLDTGNFHLEIVAGSALDIHWTEGVDLIGRDGLDDRTLHVRVAAFKQQPGEFLSVTGKLSKELVDDPCGVQMVVLNTQQVSRHLKHVPQMAQCHGGIIGKLSLFAVDIFFDCIVILHRLKLGKPSAGIALVVDVAFLKHFSVDFHGDNLLVDLRDQVVERLGVSAVSASLVLSDRGQCHFIHFKIAVDLFRERFDLCVSAADGRCEEHPLNMIIKPAPDMINACRILILELGKAIVKNILYTDDQ